MKSKLLDTLFFSEKRKNLLLFLADGPKSSGEIKEAFDFPWKSMIPQIKQLLKTGLVEKEGDMYRLSGMGPVVVANMKHLLGTLELYEENMDYWKDHELSSLPPFLRERIHELERCRVIPLKNESILLQNRVLNSILASGRVRLFFSAFYSELPFFYSELLERKIETGIIISEAAFKDMQEELLEDKNSPELKNSLFGTLFKGYRKETGKLLDRENRDIFVYTGTRLPAAVLLTDDLLSVVLYGKNGVLTNQYLLCQEPGALKWGEELFMYYMNNSKQICDYEVIRN
ncbi:MAG: helix-turn-helix transcriptional regulator [Methanosarcinaceae archaeon]